MQKMIDRTNLFKRFQNKWVALTDDGKVISAALTLDAVLTKAKKKGFEEPVTMKIPDMRYEFVL